MSKERYENRGRRLINMCSPCDVYVQIGVVVFNKLDFQQVFVYILLVQTTNLLQDKHFRINFSQFLSICNSIIRAQDWL